jgi:hypothetical protein
MFSPNVALEGEKARLTGGEDWIRTRGCVPTTQLCKHAGTGNGRNVHWFRTEILHCPVCPILGLDSPFAADRRNTHFVGQ